MATRSERKSRKGLVVMAGLPKTGTNPNPRVEEPVAAPANGRAALVFEHAQSMPSVREINSVVNPFQRAVNDLVQNGGASSVLLPPDDVKWARDNIRRAANNVEKGAKTKEVPELDSKGNDTGQVRVWFELKTKTVRTRKAKAKTGVNALVNPRK